MTDTDMTDNEGTTDGQVIEAELVDDTPGTDLARWQYVTLLPPTWRARWAARWRTRALAGQTVRDAVVAVLRAPWRTVAAVGRGLVHAVRVWRRWVRVYDYRDAAERAEKLADKFDEIRTLSLFRWKVTVAVLGGTGAAGGVVVLVDGPRLLFAAVAVGAMVLAWVGRRRDGAPGRRPVLAGPRTLTWTMDPQVLVDAFRDAS